MRTASDDATIARKRHRVRAQLLDTVRGGLDALKDRHVRDAFRAYDGAFLNHLFRDSDVAIKFVADGTMPRSSSTIAFCRHVPPDRKYRDGRHVELHISRAFIDGLFRDGGGDGGDGGQHCLRGNRGIDTSGGGTSGICDRLDALMDVLEHEIVHLLEDLACRCEAVVEEEGYEHEEQKEEEGEQERRQRKKQEHGETFRLLAKNIFGHNGTQFSNH